jgi:metal-responsive CopG/Arc/MetJ family transcriptional regulator
MKVIPKKRAPPGTGKDPLVALRMPPSLIKTINAWAKQNAATRSEAIRRLVELGLGRK